MLADHLTGRYHRISRQAYHVVGLMDGKRSLAKIWEAACANLEDDMPTQDEVIALLANLHRTDILMADIPPDTRDLYKRYAQERTGKVVSTFRSPMSIKIPILDPDRLLSFLKPVTDLLVSRFFFDRLAGGGHFGRGDGGNSFFGTDRKHYGYDTGG